MGILDEIAAQQAIQDVGLRSVVDQVAATLTTAERQALIGAIDGAQYSSAAIAAALALRGHPINEMTVAEYRRKRAGG